MMKSVTKSAVLGPGVMLLLMASAIADDSQLASKSQPFDYRVSGTCLASPEGFNARLEPVNAGVSWTLSFTGAGRVDDHGGASGTVQAVDTASFGVGPRMHAPSAYAYDETFTVVMRQPQGGGETTLHVGSVSGTFTAGPYTGKPFSMSGFDLARAFHGGGEDVFGSATSPVPQTVSLPDGRKYERVCVLTVTSAPRS